MIEFGNALRLAREAKGFTQAQIAEMTRMAPTTVADLENENFERIAAPIYGRGFVKLYCEAVGIDPKPLVDEFMAIYNGERDTGIKERKSSAPAKSPEPPAFASVAAPEPPTPKPELAPAPEPPPAQKTEDEQMFSMDLPPAESASQSRTRIDTDEVQPVVSRYAAPMRTEPSGLSIPPSFWRICALLAVAIVLFWGIIVGVRALYRATTSDVPPAADMPTPAPAADAASAAKDDAKATAKKDAPMSPRADIKRESQKIPPLYMD